MQITLVRNLFLFSFAVVVLVLAILSQKPQCINSKLIEKITFSDQSYVFNCDLAITVPFSKEFSRANHELQIEMQAFEQWLSRYWRLNGPQLKVQISEKPIVTRIVNGQIQIWNQNFKSSWELQRNLLDENLKSQITNSILRNFLSDFYVRVWNQNMQRGYGNLSSFLSYRWWIAFQSLKIPDQLQFLSFLAKNQELYRAQPESSFDQVVEIDKLIRTAAEKNSVFARFQQNLNKIGGLQPYHLKAKFDYLIMNSKINSQSVAQLNSLQKSYPDKSFGLWDSQSIYHVPSRSYIAASALKEISAHHYIWEICDDIQMQSLFKITAQVQKVLIVKNCDLNQSEIYSSYVSQGIKGFAARASKASFVLFDLPSLRSLKEVIHTEIKIFDLMLNRGQHTELLTNLGWQSVNYDLELNIYRTQSVVDSIESFRVLEN